MRKDGLKVLTSGENGVSCCGRGQCCENSPGWFGPGEVEKAAEWMKMSIEDFVNQYLVLAAVKLTAVAGQPVVEAYAPTKVDPAGQPLEGAGRRVSRVYHHMKGACVFFKDRRCGIHPVRPMECRGYFCEQPESLNISHEQIGQLYYDAWKAAQPAKT